MKFQSLRARLIAGTVGWTLTLMVIAICAGVAIVREHPRQAMFIHNGLLAFLGAVMITAGALVIRRGMSPFITMRERLAEVRDGRSARLEGEYPTEVTPLVEDLNTLLEEREERVARAVAKAGDLAHGLKTPLAILMQDIEHADAAGQHDLAASMRQQVDRMRRQIDSHLAQARATARGSLGARAVVAAAAEAIARAMERLHASRQLAIVVHAPAELAVRVPAEDLEEILGNLVDNACKWTSTRVVITAVATNGVATIDVDDDGRGLEASMRAAVLQRGVRADERAPGSGLGLAIVRDLVDAYDGTITLDSSPLGGLRARVTLPLTS